MEPRELIEKLLKYNDVETATAIWAQANQLVKEFTEIKKMCQATVEQHLLDTGELKGHTETASYGFTQPKAKLVLNKERWEQALLDNLEIRQVQTDYEYAQLKLHNAQKAYMDKEVPTPRVYIK